jgi:hypothetical protein
LVLGIVSTLLVGGCGSGDEVDTAAPTTSTSAPAPPPAPPETGQACTVSAEASGPLRELGFEREGVGQPPPGWVDPVGARFDWDADGAADTIQIDTVLGVVRIGWSGGTLEVTGVRTDFSDEPEVSVRPAAVADVTGDGMPDLIVAHEGTAAVLVGPGADAASGTVAFADIGTAVPGWQSPPVQPADVRIPLDTGTVEPLWDLTGDGVDDFAVYSEVRRAQGPAAFYAGKRCDGVDG